ncbi:MAG: SUF system NifU family Fe-S cluster assembly protein [Clostridia bacterium]|nr:SUF system NifU family Fe-S cluster assembly protein [Clostridia bacterium]
MSFDDIYKELILEHYRHPHNRGRLDRPDVEVELSNPLCGDEVTLTLRLDDGRIDDARFEGRGCSISIASASMMTERLKGLSLQEAQDLLARFLAVMRGESPAEDDDLGELESLRGVARLPVRIKCATLAWHALEEALRRVASAAS